MAKGRAGVEDDYGYGCWSPSKSASASVVLEDVMKNRRPGTLGVLAAMGPGFCSELVALEW